MTQSERYAARAEVYKLGLNDRKSAKLLREPESTFSNWRRRNGLKLHREYKKTKFRDSIKFSRSTGVPMTKAIIEPDQQERMDLFLRVAGKCRADNISSVMQMIHEVGLKTICEGMRR